jgi:hypothetical protein
MRNHLSLASWASDSTYLLSLSDCWVSSHCMKSQRGGGLFLKKYVSKKRRIFDKWIIKNCTKFLLWVYYCGSTAGSGRAHSWRTLITKSRKHAREPCTWKPCNCHRSRT